jgi:hypothetical protein
MFADTGQCIRLKFPSHCHLGMSRHAELAYHEHVELGRRAMEATAAPTKPVTLKAPKRFL